VFALWFSENMPEQTAGIDLFFFGDDLKIRSIASFHEPDPPTRRATLKNAR
jgi:hypothetical protein